MEATAPSSGKRCSWCGTLNSANCESCSKCSAALSTNQTPSKVALAAAPARAPQQTELSHTPDYVTADKTAERLEFERVSVDVMKSLGLGSSFVSNQTIALAVAGCLAVYALISLTGVFVDVSQLAKLPKNTTGLRTPAAEITGTVPAILLIRLLLIGVSLVTAVFFLVWIYRAHKNLKALGVTELKYSPGWAIGGFFVPVINIVRPYQVVTEIWKASGSGARRSGGAAWIYEPTPVFISLWWGLWLLSGFLDFISFAMVAGGGQAEQLLVASRQRIVYYLVSIACAGLAIALVWRIDARQEDANRANSSTAVERPGLSEFVPDQL